MLLRLSGLIQTLLQAIKKLPIAANHSEKLDLIEPHRDIDIAVRETFALLGLVFTKNQDGSFIAEIHRSWRSYGELIKVTVQTNSSIVVSSKSVFPLAIIDFGKNANNVRAFTTGLRQRTRSLTTPLSPTEFHCYQSRSRRPRGISRAWFFVAFLYTFGPILSVLCAVTIASLLDCKLSEGDAHPCICLGVDIGVPLTFLSIMGWLAIITLPTGLFAMLVITFLPKK